MNLRISNLSYEQEMDIIATDSAHLFDGTALSTTTDTTLTLIPKSCDTYGPLIEGRLSLAPDDDDVVFMTDPVNGQVTVSQSQVHRLIVPLGANIAIEWNEGITELLAY